MSDLTHLLLKTSTCFQNFYNLSFRQPNISSIVLIRDDDGIHYFIEADYNSICSDYDDTSG